MELYRPRKIERASPTRLFFCTILSTNGSASAAASCFRSCGCPVSPSHHGSLNRNPAAVTKLARYHWAGSPPAARSACSSSAWARPRSSSCSCTGAEKTAFGSWTTRQGSRHATVKVRKATVSITKCLKCCFAPCGAPPPDAIRAGASGRQLSAGSPRKHFLRNGPAGSKAASPACCTSATLRASRLPVLFDSSR